MSISFIRHLSLGIILTFSFSNCDSQSNNKSAKKIGGPCEGCEAVYEYGSRILTSVDTLPLFSDNDPKLKVFGTVFLSDGKTPAKDVVIYAYHTNREGIYQQGGDEENWGRRHGFIRGWVKTDQTGQYTFYTFRPGAYPGGSEPEHIHMILKEPHKHEYYIDDILFDDDPHLSQSDRKNRRNRGGSGIVKPEFKNGIWYVHRDIILGRNIPNY